MKKLNEMNHPDHVLPFLWIHGEDKERYTEEIQHIADAGIRSLCVEARPHKDFNGPQWFSDLEHILKECRKRNMHMWLLDDSHFPTGFANGEVQKNYPSLRKKYLCLNTRDFHGPSAGSGAFLNWCLKEEQDQILGVYLMRRHGFETAETKSCLDLTDQIRWVEDYHTGRPLKDFMGRDTGRTGGKVPYVGFDLPEGDWSLHVLTVSCQGGEKETEGYLNPLLPEATDILLKTVYQPVYDHFRDEFGKTFMGFFSDEPRFGNIHGAEHSSIGRNSAMVLPWRDDMVELLEEEGKKNQVNTDHLKEKLVLLFIDDSREAHVMRYLYMDLVSQLYSDNFDGRIAAWCHDHGCAHIGHCIEDNGAASRLGYGAGHLFRAMAHADMAGVDVVIQQLMPGMNHGLYKGMHQPGWDGTFFTYLLGKFGASLAHLDKKKKGRAMCELFGAYGWSEGNRFMKWLADYMMVRGINYLVPHAFDAAAFPDPDCPPQLCADGHNPQYPEFRELMNYCQRICTLLSDGRNVTDTALYYNAEGEWSGRYMPTELPAQKMADAFMDYELVSMDYLARASFSEGEMRINTEQFRSLVIPYAERLPQAVMDCIHKALEHHVSVYLIDALPEETSQGRTVDSAWLMQQPSFHLVSLSDLTREMHVNHEAELSLDHAEPYLRYYHYHHDDGEVYYFVNEDTGHSMDVSVTGAEPGYTSIYDPFTDTLYEDENAFDLHLAAGESRIVLVTKQKEKTIKPEQFIPARSIRLQNADVSIVGMEDLSLDHPAAYRKVMTMAEPDYLSRQDGYETFSGRIRYTFHFEMENVCRARLTVQGAQEGVRVYVNGKEAGVRICPPYVFELSDLQKGSNEIIIEVNTAAGRHMNDFLSQFMPLAGEGIAGALLETE